MKEHIEQLKTMKAELLQRVSAIEAAIAALSSLAYDSNADEDSQASADDYKPSSTGSTSFKSCVDLSQIPDYNPGCGGIRD